MTTFVETISRCDRPGCQTQETRTGAGLTATIPKRTREPHPAGVIVECGCQKRGILVRLGESREKYLFIGKCHSCGTEYRASITYYLDEIQKSRGEGA